MAIRLPRLMRVLPLVEENRTPSVSFHQWWDSAMKQIESSVSRLELALSAAGIAIDGTTDSSKVVTTSETLATTDRVVLVDATSAAVVATLPPASEMTGVTLRFKKTDASVNLVTVQPDGSETIDGAATQTLPNQYDTLTIFCDGTTWWIF